MKNAHKNRPNAKCIYCGLESKPHAISRWHNENCRNKEFA